MKKYIKPAVEITNVELQLLSSNSITSVSGADGLGSGEGEFAGGNGDSRYYDEWDD